MFDEKVLSGTLGSLVVPSVPADMFLGCASECVLLRDMGLLPVCILFVNQSMLAQSSPPDNKGHFDELMYISRCSLPSCLDLRPGCRAIRSEPVLSFIALNLNGVLYAT